MEKFWGYVIKFLKIIGSYFVAIARLFVWTVLFFVSGLQRTLFMRSEVHGVDFKVRPLRCDVEDMDENLAYIDKLCMENPDLVETMEEKMLEDEEFDEFDDNEDEDEED